MRTLFALMVVGGVLVVECVFVVDFTAQPKAMADRPPLGNVRRLRLVQTV